MAKYDFQVTNKVELNALVKKIWVVSFIIFAILILILFLPWQQTVKGKGNVVAFDPTQRDYSVLAPVEGFVEKFYVHENEYVTKGTPLFKMVDLDKEYLLKLETIQRNLEEQIENVKLELKSIDQQTVQTKEFLANGIAVYKQKLAQVNNRIKSLKLQQVSLEKNYEVVKISYERVEALYKKGLESKKSFEAAQNSYVKADAEYKKIAIDIDVEKKNISILQKEQEKFINTTNNKLQTLSIAELNTQNKHNVLSQQLQNQNVVIERYKNSEVVAPKDGYVVRLLKNDQNRYIKKGEEVLHFSPKVTKKAVLLKVSDFNMPLIKEGLPVRIMFYGWPALQISGWPKIQFGSFGGVIEKVEHISHEKGYYYAYVLEDENEPWPEGDELRIGTQASVWVRLSTVPIWYQLWRLMNALPPQMVHPDREKY